MEVPRLVRKEATYYDYKNEVIDLNSYNKKSIYRLIRSNITPYIYGFNKIHELVTKKFNINLKDNLDINKFINYYNQMSIAFKVNKTKQGYQVVNKEEKILIDNLNKEASSSIIRGLKVYRELLNYVDETSLTKTFDEGILLLSLNIDNKDVIFNVNDDKDILKNIYYKNINSYQDNKVLEEIKTEYEYFGSTLNGTISISEETYNEYNYYLEKKLLELEKEVKIDIERRNQK